MKNKNVLYIIWVALIISMALLRNHWISTWIFMSAVLYYLSIIAGGLSK